MDRSSSISLGPAAETLIFSHHWIVTVKAAEVAITVLLLSVAVTVTV
jgi:hypothetical protein